MLSHSFMTGTVELDTWVIIAAFALLRIAFLGRPTNGFVVNGFSRQGIRYDDHNRSDHSRPIENVQGQVQCSISSVLPGVLATVPFPNRLYVVLRLRMRGR